MQGRTHICFIYQCIPRTWPSAWHMLGVDKYFLNECILKIKISLLVLSCRAVWREMMTDEVSGPYAEIERKLEQIGGVFSQNFCKPDEQTVSAADLQSRGILFPISRGSRGFYI